MRGQFFLLLLSGTLAFADPSPTPLPTPSPSPIAGKPVVTRENGKPFVVTWKDGRVATLMMNKNDPYLAVVPFGVFENDCADHLESTCVFKEPIEIDRMYFKWTAHSNPDKIGKTVRLKSSQINNGDPFDLGTDNQLVGSNRITQPIAAKAIPNDQMICRDYSFLPGATPQGPASFRISRWDSEAQIQNPETGISENRVLGGAIDVDMERQSDGHYEVIIKGYYTAAQGNTVILSNGDVISWQIETPNGDYCHIAMKPDFASAVTMLNDYQAHLPDNFVPYVYGSDENTTMFKFFFDLFDQDPSSYEVD